jgi:hypothetical protein
MRSAAAWMTARTGVRPGLPMMSIVPISAPSQ